MQRPFDFALLLAPMGLWNGNDGKSSLRHEANFVSLFANQYAKRPLFALLLSQIYLACLCTAFQMLMLVAETLKKVQGVPSWPGE